MKKYDKKVTVSLTEEDHTTLQDLADNDRRHINQMASMMIEDMIKAKQEKSTSSISSVSTEAA